MLDVLTALFDVVYFTSDKFILGFNALFALVALVVMEIVCALVAWRASSRINRVDATILIRGEV